MKIKMLSSYAFFICTIAFLSLAPVAPGQSQPAADLPAMVTTPAAHTVTDIRPTLIVMSFESGTVAAKVKDKHGLSGFLAALRGDQSNEHYDPADLGTGIADMLVEKLLNTGEFRLMDRKQGDTKARYMVMGSVTKFGFEEHQVGGFAASVATFGMLGLKKHKTEVTLTARVIDIATGEIIASFDGEGVSNKGGGLTVMGLGAHGGGGLSGENKNFKETAIGEATERAVQNLSERLEAKRALLASR